MSGQGFPQKNPISNFTLENSSKILLSFSCTPTETNKNISRFVELNQQRQTSEFHYSLYFFLAINSTGNITRRARIVSMIVIRGAVIEKVLMAHNFSFSIFIRYPFFFLACQHMGKIIEIMLCYRHKQIHLGIFSFRDIFFHLNQFIVNLIILLSSLISMTLMQFWQLIIIEGRNFLVLSC